MINQQRWNAEETTWVDEQGRTWLLQKDYVLEELDFAVVHDSQTENDQLRSAWLLQRYAGRAGFEGLC